MKSVEGLRRGRRIRKNAVPPPKYTEDHIKISRETNPEFHDENTPIRNNVNTLNKYPAQDTLLPVKTILEKKIKKKKLRYQRKNSKLSSAKRENLKKKQVINNTKITDARKQFGDKWDQVKNYCRECRELVLKGIDVYFCLHNSVLGRRSEVLYDDKGILLSNGRDLCDCLDEECPGCHFPCPKCASNKCGLECRVKRKYVYERIDIEGSEGSQPRSITQPFSKMNQRTPEDVHALKRYMHDLKMGKRN